MFNITNHQGNANQNHNELLPHTRQGGYYKKTNKPTRKNQVLERMWRNLNTYALLVGMQNGSAAVENSMMIPQKIKSKTTYEPAIPLLGIYLKELKVGSQRDICTLMFRAAHSQRWKPPKCPSTDEWINKMQYIHTFNLKQ